ncbi:hypothetical protein [Roseivirga sp. 4D4]|uniref:hypothetical protein n=1 Tax=Roseivirga sp. 4D4 TaxID=1889784 RepID=UPI001112E3BE|nr:hypothetical protein [Roseivirga sp. 4D4]
MRRAILGCLFIFLTNILTAQINQVHRYESDHRLNNLRYDVISNQENGVMVIKPIEGKVGKSDRIEFTHLDNSLKESWSGYFEIPQGQQLVGEYYDQNITYLLFYAPADNSLLNIVALDNDKEEIINYQTDRIGNLEIVEFKTLKSSAIIAGYVDGLPAVFAFDLPANTVRTLPNLYNKNSELLEVRINNDGLTLNVLVSEVGDDNTSTVVVNTYDYQGQPVRRYTLETLPSFQLRSAVSSSIVDKSQVVVGLYSLGNDPYPTGIYVNHVDKLGKQTMTYRNFGEFESFFDHLGERRGKKIKSRALLAKKNDKNWSYKTEGLIENLCESDDKIVFNASFFTPWTIPFEDVMLPGARNRRVGSFEDPFISPYTTSRQPIIAVNNPNVIVRPPNFEVTHAFSLALDQEGKLLSDNSYTVGQNPENNLNSFGAFQAGTDGMHYAYYFKKDVMVRTLDNLTEKSGEKSPLKLLEEGEKVKNDIDQYRGIVSWYDNKFLVYGVQQVKSATKPAMVRTVFFINSIAAGTEGTDDN